MTHLLLLLVFFGPLAACGIGAVILPNRFPFGLLAIHVLVGPIVGGLLAAVTTSILKFAAYPGTDADGFFLVTWVGAGLGLASATLAGLAQLAWLRITGRVSAVPQVVVGALVVVFVLNGLGRGDLSMRALAGSAVAVPPLVGHWLTRASARYWER